MGIEQLLGKTLVNIEQFDDEIIFTANTGEQWKMWHNQDCCESVSIEDINGDLSDLLNSPITQAEESTDDTPKTETYNKGEANEWTFTDESATWTFYKLATVKGYVTIRWYGSSNGYYSESVDFYKITEIDSLRE